MADRAIPSGAEHTGERKSQDLYERLRVLEEALNRAPWARGRLLDTDQVTSGIAVPGGGIPFTAGTARSLRHGLGRAARGFAEVYLPGVVSAAHCGLRPTAPPSGISVDTHITITAASTGTCAILVW